MRLLSSSAIRVCLSRASLFVLATLSFAFGERPAAPLSNDPTLAALNRAVTDHPGDVAACIARTRYRVETLNRERKDMGDFPLAQDYASNDRAFTDALKPILTEMDTDIARLPVSAALLIERARLRGVYQVCSEGLRRFTFDFNDPIKDLIRATELEPNNASAWYELGLAHLSLWQVYTTSVKTRYSTTTPENRAATKKAALEDARHAFSVSILAQPDQAGFAHLLRLWTQRELNEGRDWHQIAVDADAIIRQDLAPTDAGWHAALHPSRPASKHDSYLAEAYWLRGQAHVDQGKSSDALADFDQALTLEPNHIDVLLDRGRLLVRRGDYIKALADLTQVTKTRPRLADGWFWQGLAHEGKGEIELARADLSQAVLRDKAISSKLEQTRYDPASPNPDRGLAPPPTTAEVPPSGTALDHKNAGNALRGRGDDYGALREYSVAVQIDPAFADGYNNRGSSYRSFRETDLAFDDLNRAITLDPKHRAAFLNRAPLWSELGDRARASSDYDRAVEYADTDLIGGQVHLSRGLFHESAKNLKAAEADYRRATELSPADARAWSALALLELNQSRVPAAIEHLRQSLGRDSKNVMNRVYLAVALALNDDASSGEELEIALRDHPTREQLTEAEAIVDRALKTRPISPRLDALKARISRETGPNQIFV